MDKEILKNHHIIILTVLIIFIHFAVSSIFGHFFASKVGKEFGNIVTDGLIKSTSSGDAEEIYNDMMTKRDKSYNNWKVSAYLISLPIGPFTKTIRKNVREKYLISPTLSKRITMDQFTVRAKVIDYFSALINSVVFGLLFFTVYKWFKLYRLKT